MKFIVTGTSRISGERVNLTPPCEEETANLIARREMKKKPSKRAYLRIKAVPFKNK